jgi:hypothetical protein
MIIVNITYTRPSKSAPLFSASDELKTEFLQKYRYTGKSISTITTQSPDGLTAVVTNKWKSQADLDEYLSDPLCESTREAREAHNVTHGIQQAVDIAYEPDAPVTGE